MLYVRCFAVESLLCASSLEFLLEAEHERKFFQKDQAGWFEGPLNWRPAKG